MKYIITESQYNKAIDKFISHQFKGFEERTSPQRYDSNFWVKDGEVIAEIGKGTYYIVIRSDIWNIISDMFSLDHKEVKTYIKQWLEEHFMLGRLTPLEGRTESVRIWGRITNWE
jgi:hypothetical protein